jgi:hypothetical protein
MVARHRPSVGTMSVLLFSSWIEKKKDPKYPTLKLSTPQRRKVWYWQQIIGCIHAHVAITVEAGHRASVPLTMYSSFLS